jgi:phosphopantetheine--protein transferase-like protein
VIAAVHLPDSPKPVPDEVLAKLTGPEADRARAYGGYRQVQFTGGRLALRAARRQIGAPLGPIPSNDRGAPVLPQGYVGSVSHKRTLAVALVARDRGATLGVDIEDYTPARPAIADRILRPSELASISELPPDRFWTSLLIRFSIKESIYKAIDPHVRRYVKFHEAEVTPDLSGSAKVRMFLEQGEGPFDIQVRYDWLHGRLLTSAVIRPA